MWSKFARVALISFVKNDLRRDGVLKELERVGVSYHSDFEVYKVDTPTHDSHRLVIEDFANQKGGDDDMILILEDDIRFLVDCDAIYDILDAAPKCDVVVYDPFVHLKSTICKNLRAFPFQKMMNGVYGTSCYSLTRSAARTLVKSYSIWKDEPPDSQKFINHQDLSCSFSTKNLCIQLSYDDSINASKFGREIQHIFYLLNGVDYSLYNVPAGYGYGKYIDSNDEVVD